MVHSIEVPSLVKVNVLEGQFKLRVEFICNPEMSMLLLLLALYLDLISIVIVVPFADNIPICTKP